MAHDTTTGSEEKRICMGVWNSMRHDARVARSADTLASSRAVVTVIAASWESDDWGSARHPLGFQVFTIPRRPPWALSIGGRGASPLGVLLRVIRTFPSQCRFMIELWKANADVYHAHDIQALPWVWLIAKLRRSPIVYDAHEISTDRTSLKRLGGVIRRIEGFLARHCDAMITTTDMRADYFVEQYDIPRPTVIQNRPHFVDVKRTDRLRDALRVPAELPIVLYQGGLQPGRGLELLVEQIPRVPAAHFVFLGNGVLRGTLQSRVDELGQGQRVHFLAAVPWDELASWTASADIGVQLIENTCLNHYTTDSNKLFEYGMAGLPVLASDFPEIRRIVEGNGLGLLVDPANADDVHRQLEKLVNDNELRESFAASARRARHSLSWETQSPMLVDLYRSLLEKSAR